MDGERRKRKMDEDENEEEKIEKFFALIKSTREVRERLVEARETPAAAKPQSPAPAPWNPTFVLEDFVEAPPQPPPAEAEKAGTSTEGEKQESGEGSGNKGLDLDLNLSL